MDEMEGLESGVGLYLRSGSHCELTGRDTRDSSRTRTRGGGLCFYMDDAFLLKHSYSCWTVFPRLIRLSIDQIIITILLLLFTFNLTQKSNRCEIELFPLCVSVALFEEHKVTKSFLKRHLKQSKASANLADLGGLCQRVGGA